MGTQSTWGVSVWLQYHGSGVRGTELLNISSFLDPRDLFFSCYPRNLIIFSDILVKMDWVTVAIGLGVCVITAMVLYLISVYSFKEHTFEEALAEQQSLPTVCSKLTKAVLKKKKRNRKKLPRKTKTKKRGRLNRLL